MGVRKKLITSKIAELEEERVTQVKFAIETNKQIADISLELVLWKKLLKLEEKEF